MLCEKKFLIFFHSVTQEKTEKLKTEQDEIKLNSYSKIMPSEFSLNFSCSENFKNCAL